MRLKLVDDVPPGSGAYGLGSPRWWLTVWAVLASGCGAPSQTAASKDVAAAPAGAVPGESAPEAQATFVPEEGFTLLSLADFVPFKGDQGTWREEKGEIVCSGTPKSYAHTKETFGNFTWRGEYKYAPKADATAEQLEKSNTGFMIHIQEPHKVWPRSLEVQGRFDEICSIKSNGGVPDLVIVDDPAARTAARKPVGEWNAVEIVSKDGGLTSILNGQKICTSQAGELTSGLLGLQSELYEVHFRHLRIRKD
jgi:hypothetical protein